MYMSKDDYIDYQANLNETVVQMMLDVVLLLAHYGIVEIPASNVMRLLGTPEEEASKWDNAVLSVDENGELKVTEKEQEGIYSDNSNDDGNITLH